MRGGRELLCSKLTKYLENSRQILAKMIHHAVVVVILLLIMTAPRHNEAAQQLDNGIINVWSVINLWLLSTNGTLPT